MKQKDEEILKEIEKERLEELEIERENLLSFAIVLAVIGFGLSIATLLVLGGF